MHIEAALTTYLLNHTGLKALIGTRFGWDNLPQGTALPAVVGQHVSGVKDHYLSGICNQMTPVYQFSAYATTRAGARLVADQLEAALSDYTGTLSGITIQHIKLINEFISTETTSDAVLKTHIVDLEFEITYLKE